MDTNTTTRPRSNKTRLIIVILVALIAAGLIIWQYLAAQQAQEEASRAASSQQVPAPAPAPNTESTPTQPVEDNNVKLADWGVELKPSDKYGIITAEKDAADKYTLTSSKLQAGTYTCQGGNTGKLGSLRRSTSPDTSGLATSIELNGVYYTFSSALQNTCYQETELNTLGREYISDLSALLVTSE